MPLGVTHRTINTLASIPAAAGLYYQLHRTPTEIALLIGGYTFATFLMNPDLDLVSEGYYSWGLLRFYWWPYQRALAHRCFFSHFPVVSTLLRIVYLLWLPVLIIYLLGTTARAFARETVLDWYPGLEPSLILIVLGMVCSDTLHFILDITSTRMKRLFGGKRRRRNVGFFEHHGQTNPWRRRRR